MGKEILLPTSDPKARKFQLTINNPLGVELPDPSAPEKVMAVPFDHDEIKRRLQKLTSLCYWCMADEIGNETGTPHTHIYLCSQSPIRFSTVKNQFPTAHIEAANGSSFANRDYIKKEGKWKATDKSETSVEGTFEEWGEIPINEKIKKNGGMPEAIYGLVVNGAPDEVILQTYPEAFTMLTHIQRLRQLIVEERARDTWRDVKVTYIYGATETGKSRDVMERHGYSHVYRVTDYNKHPWDGYDSTRHSVVLLEEFRSSLKITDMLNILDGYPLSLPARYANKVATYDTVYITTNIPLRSQYPQIQLLEPQTWKAFLRRINAVEVYTSSGEVLHYDSVHDYMERNRDGKHNDTISDAEFYRLLYDILDDTQKGDKHNGE